MISNAKAISTFSRIPFASPIYIKFQFSFLEEFSLDNKMENFRLIKSKILTISFQSFLVFLIQENIILIINWMVLYIWWIYLFSVELPPCLMFFLLDHSSYIITVEMALKVFCNLFSSLEYHQYLMVCKRFSPSMFKPAQVAKWFHSFSTMEIVRKKLFMGSWCCVSKHQHLETIVILILCKSLLVEILPTMTSIRKSWFLKSNLSTKSYQTLLVFLLLFLLSPMLTLLRIYHYFCYLPCFILNSFL